MVYLFYLSVFWLGLGSSSDYVYIIQNSVSSKARADFISLSQLAVLLIELTEIYWAWAIVGTLHTTGAIRHSLWDAHRELTALYIDR